MILIYCGHCIFYCPSKFESYNNKCYICYFVYLEATVRKSMRITPFQRRRPTIRRRGEVGPVDLDGTPLSAMKKYSV